MNLHLNLYFDAILRDSFFAMKNLNETEEIDFGNIIFNLIKQGFQLKENLMGIF